MSEPINNGLNWNTDLTEQLDTIAADTVLKGQVELSAQTNLTTRLINTQFRLEGELAGAIAVRQQLGYDRVSPNLLSISHHNSIEFYIALRMNNQGFYGAAGSLLRSVFERLILAKLCAVSSDLTLFKHWHNGGDVYLSSQVFKRLAKPDVEEFKRFWRGLCEWSHAGPGWGQALVGYHNIRQQIAVRYTPLLMLLDCNFHLLNRHLATPPVIRLIDQYKDGYRFRSVREAAKACIKEVRSGLRENSSRLVRNFAATWEIRK